MRAKLRRRLWQLLGRLRGQRLICAWCPDFDKKDPKNAGASHGLCPNCAAKVRSDWKEA